MPSKEVTHAKVPTVLYLFSETTSFLIDGHLFPPYQWGADPTGPKVPTAGTYNTPSGDKYLPEVSTDP